MIHFVSYLDTRKWRISVYVTERCGEEGEIIEALADMGCRGAELAGASNELKKCGMNIGITYSVGAMRNSILVLGLQDSRAEFVNTMRHEQHHVISHICKSDGIDMNTEEAAYIDGEVGEGIYIGLKKSDLL